MHLPPQPAPSRPAPSKPVAASPDTGRPAVPSPVAASPVVVVAGPSGAGKTTIGRLLAERLGVPYAEADAFHPPANIAKMRAGQPLDDADRAPWLDAIAAWIIDRRHRGGVVSCSALRHRYRDRLRAADPTVRFVSLLADRETLLRRVAGREDHFMPASLSDSQLAALEPLRPDERGMTVDAGKPSGEIVQAILTALARPVAG